METILKKIAAITLVFSICIGTGSLLKFKELESSKLWAGVSYLASKKGASAEDCLAIGVAGVWESTLQGAVWGAAFGSAAGLAVGAGVGL